MNDLKITANRLLNNIVKKKIPFSKTTVPNLPEEILLIREVLNNVRGTVCQRWRDLIPLPIQCRKAESEITFLKKKHLTATQSNKRYLANGDGLFLYCDRSDRSSLSLVNPVGKKVISLPRLPFPCSPLSHKWALACSPMTSEYKVVCRDIHSKMTYILTVGIDQEWRKLGLHIDIDHIDIDEQCYSVQGICGVIYWYTGNTCKDYLIALDVEKETVYNVYFPEECRKVWVYNTNSDRHFSFAVERFTEYCYEFWELVDYKNGGEWRKVGMLDLECKVRELDELGIVLPRIALPVAILRSGYEVVHRFGAPGSAEYITYNFKAGQLSRWSESDFKLPLMFTRSNNLVVL